MLAFGWFLACLCHFNMSRYVLLWSIYCTKMVWYYNEIPGYEILMPGYDILMSTYDI